MKIYLIKESEALQGRDPREEIIAAYSTKIAAEKHLKDFPDSGFHWREIQEIELQD
jgi:hypothetical protein